MQISGPWDPWLLVVENSQLFAQRGHRVLTGRPHEPPKCNQSEDLKQANPEVKLGNMTTIGQQL